MGKGEEVETLTTMAMDGTMNLSEVAPSSSAARTPPSFQTTSFAAVCIVESYGRIVGPSTCLLELSAREGLEKASKCLSAPQCCIAQNTALAACRKAYSSLHNLPLWMHRCMSVMLAAYLNHVDQ
jgi:hypothetical protein